MVGKTPKGIGINNTKNVIATIGKHINLMDILEYLRLSPYEIWWEMEHNEKNGSRELFLHW